MGCGGGGHEGDNQRALSQIQTYNTQQNSNKINQAFNAFNPGFYNKTQQAYTNYAMPQLGQQQRNMTNQLGYTLAGRGLEHSSAGDQSRNALAAASNQGQMSIGNAAVQQGNMMRQQIAGEKQRLLGQAATSQDPTSVGRQAYDYASQQQAPSFFQPLGDMFGQFANQFLQSQQGNQYNQFANQYLNAFSNPAIYGQNTGGK
jgi:hypothetical protein